MTTETLVLTIIAALFAVAGLWIAVAWRGRPGIWAQYWSELLVIAAVLVPAWAGGPWPTVAWGAIAAVCTWEVARVVGRWPAARARGAPLVLWPPLGAAALAYVAGMPSGFGLVVFCFGVVEINDATAMLVGGAIGRRRLAPALSPGKTIEGTVAGAVAAIALSQALAFAVPGFTRGEALLAGIVLALAGPAADLAASWIKRRAAVKDYGTLAPPHGGLFDVYDSLLGAAPVFLLFTLAVAR